MSPKYIRIVFSLIITLFCIFNLSAQEWTFVKEKEGIKIYTRNEDSVAIKSFKGVADFKTNMDRMKKVIGRIESFEWWDEDVSEIKVLAYEEEKFIRYYLVYDVPWPLSDRDLCVEAIITNDPVTGIRTVRATPMEGVIPESPDNVRIKYYWQQWTMEPKGNGIVHVTLEGSVDPAGSIPAWIINMVITNTPLNVMTKARNEVEK
ncbi:MAG: hypothetical protein HGA23_00445 [Bacteroidales bacterium]|nr:hypothetical protein [Bacteroidales bacterium]